MSIFHKPTRHQVIVTSCVLAWIFLVNVAAVALGITAWALYFVTIFFFALGADKKNIPSIFEPPHIVRTEQKRDLQGVE